MMIQSKRPNKPYVLMTALIIGVALSACATVPEIREIEGPIVLDAPDSVVRGDDSVTPPAQTQSAPNNGSDDDYGYENVQTVPVTPITCPAGTSPHSDGSCRFLN